MVVIVHPIHLNAKELDALNERGLRTVSLTAKQQTSRALFEFNLRMASACLPSVACYYIGSNNVTFGYGSGVLRCRSRYVNSFHLIWISVAFIDVNLRPIHACDKTKTVNLIRISENQRGKGFYIIIFCWKRSPCFVRDKTSHLVLSRTKMVLLYHRSTSFTVSTKVATS